MMDNDEFLSELRSRLQRGELSAAVLYRVIQEEGLSPESQSGRVLPFSVNLLLYIVGGLFVTLGVLYLASQIWDDLGGIGRVLITLGTGLMFAGAGSHFLLRDPARGLGNVFHAIGGCLVSGGALVALDELIPGLRDIGPVAMTVGGVFVFYTLLTLYHRRAVVTFFAFANGTPFVYLLVETLAPNTDPETYAYLTMVMGASYLIYAHAFQRSWNVRLIPLLQVVGSGAFYVAGFSQIFQSDTMELLFPFLAFGGLALSTQYLKSRIVLIISTFAVISYIIYFTAEYFADSIGWPVALILLGFVIIGLGYVSINLNRKYLRSS